MKALIIIIAILTIIAILCICPVVISVSYIDEKFDYSLKYIGIKIFPKKPKKKKRITKQSDTFSDISKKDNVTNDKKQQEKTESIPENQKEKNLINDVLNSESFFDKLNQIVDMLKASKEGLKTILRHISVTDIFINFDTANEDAYKCAMDYAKINIALYNILGFISHYITVRKKSIKTSVSFGKEKGFYDISFKIKLGLGVGIVVVLGIIIKFLRNTRKREKLEEA